MQQIKKVGIFTKHNMQPRHPRIQMELEVLQANGYEAEVICNPQGIKGNHGGLWNKLRYYYHFTYFNWPLIEKFRPELKRFDAVIIYDLSLLPLIAEARALGKHVVYETIDNNVEYSFHAVARRMPFLKFLRGWITGRMKRREQYAAGKQAHKTIVNSPALRDYLATPNCLINLYSSPFETTSLEPPGSKPLALLYLGEFTHDKGGPEMLDIAKRTGVPFFIFGFITGDDLKQAVKSNPGVVQHDRMNISDLLVKLTEISKNYRLAGFSMIRPVNLSFATQEANKDIDYLSLGIPLVANDRGITLEKIKAGCGVQHNDEPALSRLISDAEFYAQLSAQSKKYYATHYSRARFERTLLEALKS